VSWNGLSKDFPNGSDLMLWQKRGIEELYSNARVVSMELKTMGIALLIEVSPKNCPKWNLVVSGNRCFSVNSSKEVLVILCDYATTGRKLRKAECP
jgi:hypothetical protein